MSDKEYVKIKLKEIFENTVESGIQTDINIDSIDYYSLFCKAAARDGLYKLMNNNLCMFKTIWNGNPSVLIIYSIPINTNEESGAKSVAERVMDFVSNIEKTFIKLEHLTCTEVPEDKFIYILVIKVLDGGEE